MASIQIQAVTQVTSGGHLAVAVLAALTALVATGYVIVYASQVLIAPSLTWSDLVTRETRQMIASRQLTPFQQLTRVGQSDPLLAELAASTQMQPVQLNSPRELREQLLAARRDLAANPSDGLREQVAQLEAVAEVCLRDANAWQSRQLYGRLTSVLVIAGTAICLSLAGFMWASRPPEEPPKVTKPFPVQVFLAGSAQKLKAAGLKSACFGMVLKGSAVGGDLSQPEVTTLPQGQCSAGRFKVTEEIGVAVPVATT
ncbi:hypothetical protein [Streptomyces cyaneofuscatus]|uniref:hypothetical protein n=1 Tax=Streptomyces cyaneofuscatus TaxID=66883 RepID=UPI00344ABF96